MSYRPSSPTLSSSLKMERDFNNGKTRYGRLRRGNTTAALHTKLTKTIRKVKRLSSLRQVFKNSEPKPEPKSESEVEADEKVRANWYAQQFWPEQALVPAPQNLRTRTDQEQDMVPAPLSLKKQRSASLSARSAGSTDAVVNFSLRVSSSEKLSFEREPTRDQTQDLQEGEFPALPSQPPNRPLPQPPKRTQHQQVPYAQSRPSSTSTLEDSHWDWEAAVDESYKIGEFVHMGEKSLEEEEARLKSPVLPKHLFQPKKERKVELDAAESVLDRGRSVSARKYRDEYFVDRPRGPARK